MMKATVSIKAFRDAMAKCAFVTERRNTIPILGMIRLQVQKDSVILSSTDLDINVRVTIAASGCLFAAKDRIGVCIPAQLLRFVQALPAQDVMTLQVSEDGRLIIDTSDGSAAFMTLPGGDWPSIFAWGEAASYTVSAFDPKVFHNGFATALPFVSQEETRYYLCGIRHVFKDGGLTLVATDGHTMIEKLLDDPENPYQADGGATVPRKSIQTFLKIFPRSGDYGVLRYQAGKYLSWECGDVFIETKLVDGIYPDYKRVIPSPRNATSRYTVDIASWKNALKRMCLGQSMKAVSLGKTQDGRLYLQHKDNDLGAIVVAVKATPGMIETCTIWADTAIGFNLYLLQRILNSYSSETVEMLMTEAKEPILFIGNHTTTVLMPMHIDHKGAMVLPQGARAA